MTSPMSGRFVEQVEKLKALAVASGKTAVQFKQLTGQYDPILQNVRVQMRDGSWHNLGMVRLSDIGDWKVLDHEVPPKA